MKHNYLFKTLLTGIVLASGSIANAQAIHPMSYTTGAGGSNFYFNYVGERFEVTYPASIAGDKNYTTPNTNDGATGTWGGFPGVAPASAIAFPTDTVINYPADSCVTAIPISIDMTGKVALLYRGAGVQFGTKAWQAQQKGAIACVLVNNVDGGPVGMAAGTDGGSVTIPVFMVSKADGDAMNSQLHNGIPVTLAVFNWGQGLTNDLGFVSRGEAQWHNGAIPGYELQAGGDPLPYRGLDGAYVANFGIADAANVTLRATTSFTPTGGSAAIVHTDSVFLASFPQLDSIYAMYCPEYNLGGALASTIAPTGKLNVTYNVSAAGVIDQFSFDNTLSYSVDLTSNVYTKGRWDATNGRPFCTTYTGPGTNTAGTYDPYVWGPSFYIKKSRYAVNSIFSVVSSSTSGINWILSSNTVNVYLLKWVDGSGSTAADGFIQNEELQLQGIGTKTFNGSTDSSFQFFTVNISADTTGGPLTSALLDSNSWYWIATEMPQLSTTNFAIGCDGVNNGYPRLFGRDTIDHYVEYYAPLWGSGDRSFSTYNMLAYGTYFTSVVPFAGTSLVTSIDSTIFPNEKGLIPNVSLSTSPWPVSTANVKPTASEFNVYPNPAASNINVSLGLTTTAKQVTYKVMSTTGKIISTETRNNVQHDVYTYNTEKLSNGVYYMIVIADEKPMFKKFTVLR